MTNLKKLKKLLLRVFFYLALSTTGFFLILYFLIAQGIIVEMPSDTVLKEIQNPQASVVRAADGSVLGRYYQQNRISIGEEQLSEYVKDALVATEDNRFYSHDGVDVFSLFRVFVKSIVLRDASGGGGSTLTQQLAKNLFPRQKFRFSSLLINKMKEIIIARKIETLYEKEEILVLYLNTVPFGEEVFGIEAASNRFFNKPNKKLTLAEAATLVGMLKATTYYSPRRHPERALGRRNVVLQLMLEHGYIDAVQLETATAATLQLEYNKIEPNKDSRFYFLNSIEDELIELLKDQDSSYNLYTSGLEIETTLDAGLQRNAEKAMYVQMQNLQKKFDAHWPKQKLWRENKTLLRSLQTALPLYAQLKEEGWADNAIDSIMNTGHEMEVFSYTGVKTEHFSVLDSIRYHMSFLQSGMMAMDPFNGHVKVYIGGIDPHFFQYDHVTSKRQVGSIFKPFVYATALEEEIDPCKFVKAEKETYAIDGKEWTPGNSGGEYEGKYSMEGALTNSVNTVSVKVLEKAGIENVIALAQNMGITADLPQVPSIALGTPSIALKEMVTAYAVFANGGNSVKPVSILRIKNAQGKVIYEYKPPRQVRQITEKTARSMVHMMESVVQEGTAARLRSTYGLTNSIAGKTGTTQNNSDGWFMAIMPKLVVGCWVGGEYPAIRFRSTALGQGANTALPIVGTFVRKTNQQAVNRKWTSGSFAQMPANWEKELNCKAFKEEFNFSIWVKGIFKKKTPEEKARKAAKKKKKKGFLKSVKGVFKKKQ